MGSVTKSKCVCSSAAADFPPHVTWSECNTPHFSVSVHRIKTTLLKFKKWKKSVIIEVCLCLQLCSLCVYVISNEACAARRRDRRRRSSLGPAVICWSPLSANHSALCEAVFVLALMCRGESESQMEINETAASQTLFLMWWRKYARDLFGGFCLTRDFLLCKSWCCGWNVGCRGKNWRSGCKCNIWATLPPQFDMFTSVL